MREFLNRYLGVAALIAWLRGTRSGVELDQQCGHRTLGRPSRRDYVIAVTVAALAVLLRWLLDPVLHGKPALPIFLIATLLVAWYSGFWPAMTTLALGGLAATVLFFHPQALTFSEQPSRQLFLIMFFAAGLTAAFLTELRRAAQHRAELLAKEAVAQQRQLLQEIQERYRAEDLLRQEVERRQRLAEELDRANAELVRRMEERATLLETRQARQMEAVGRLAGGIAHEFNNLLQIINGYTQMLLAMARPGDRSQTLLEHVLRAGERAALLTHKLVAYGRNQTLTPETVDLGQLIDNIRGVLARLLGDDVTLLIEADPATPRARVDPKQIERVLNELALNAREAMPEGGRLTIETRAAAGGPDACEPGRGDRRYAVLSVTDTGRGMDRDTVAHLFEPFFTTKSFGKSAGLGLAIVHGIIQQSGGHLKVRSETGGGTRFEIYLPASTEESGRGVTNSIAAGPVGLSPAAKSPTMESGPAAEKICCA